MIRPLLRRSSETACEYVCRRCRYHLARQPRTRHTQAFSTSARRGSNGELEETDQDYFGGFNDLSEEYSSTKLTPKAKAKEKEANTTQRRNIDRGSNAVAQLQKNFGREVDSKSENDGSNGLDHVETQGSGSSTGVGRSAGLPPGLAQLVQRLNGEDVVGHGQESDDLEASTANAAERQTSFARTKTWQHPFHDIALTGQSKIDRGRILTLSPSQRNVRRKFLAEVGVVEVAVDGPCLVSWLNDDGTPGQALTPMELARMRHELQIKVRERKASLAVAHSSALSTQGDLDPAEMTTTRIPEDKPQGFLNSSQQEVFEAIMAKLQAELPNRIAAFNAAKQSTASLDEDVDAPAGGSSSGRSAALSTQDKKPQRILDPFWRPIEAPDVSSDLVRKCVGRKTSVSEAKSEEVSSKQTLPEAESEVLIRRPLQRSYDFSRRTSDSEAFDSEAFALAARAQEVSSRNAAWGGVAPTTKPAKETRVDFESLRAMDTVSRIIPEAPSPGQSKAWGQERASSGNAPPTTQIASGRDNREVFGQLGQMRGNKLDHLKAALAQSVDGKKPDGQMVGAEKLSARKAEKPKQQGSLFRRLLNGLRDVSNFPGPRDAGNDDGLSGHLEGETRVEDATERLAKLHQQRHQRLLAAAMPSPSHAPPKMDEHGQLSAPDGDAEVGASEAIHQGGIDPERVQAAEADDSSSAGEELMTNRKYSNSSRNPEYIARQLKATKVDKAKAAVGDEQTQMTLKEAMQQTTRPAKNISGAPRTKEVVEHGGAETTASNDGSEPAIPVHETKVNLDEIKSMLPAELAISSVHIPQPDVPSLQYGLDRVLFNPGVYQLQDPNSRVYNFDPYLQKITPIQDFDFNALKEYKTSSQDRMLSELAQEHGKKYIGSTSSMTGMLAHFHYLISNWRELNLDMLSRGFHETSQTFTQLNRAPSAIFLRWKKGTYAIDADKEYDRPNVLMMLGKSMEKFLTAPREEYERYTRGSNNSITQDEKDQPEAYEYTSMGDFLMRSQLDAYDSRLPGNGTFDLKTRAVVSIRMDVEDFKPMLGYELHTLQGKFESYEREYYDMMRSTMLKYMLQARMGRMDGIFVAYHNIERMFGFQYLPIAEMDRVIHGQIDRCLGDQEFRVSLKMLNEVFEMATEKFPEQSLRFHFESAEKPANMMWVFAEPVTEDEADAIQNKSKAKIAEFEGEVMGIEKKVDGTSSASGDDSSTEPETATVVHSDPLSAYAAATAKPPSPSRDSDPDPADAISGSQADVKFMKKLSSNLQDHTKPLFAATIILKNHVNGKACQNNRPRDLGKSDRWRVDYILKETLLSAQEKWARYEDMKLRRRKVLDREDASLEEEGGGSAEMGEKMKARVEKKENVFLRQLREYAARGRHFRSRVDKLEEGKEKVVLGMPGVKGAGDADEGETEAGVEGAVAVAGEDGEVMDVEGYMRWLFSAKSEARVEGAVEVAGEDGEVRDVEGYMRWLFSARSEEDRG
ncbi:Mitochondrial protein [Teratosphaeria destructans]|uniref:Mitochondrial protein n=1 Tax=Teratosphaeria destructans TaxID=418781 RepID=A0A9W7SZE7_9PEZI|nr:Mitochondrial protein [Teratosphaeria destructans]